MMGAAALTEPVDRQTVALGSPGADVDGRLARLEKDGFNLRLWRKDPDLWKKR